MIGGIGGVVGVDPLVLAGDAGQRIGQRHGCRGWVADQIHARAERDAHTSRHAAGDGRSRVGGGLNP